MRATQSGETSTDETSISSDLNFTILILYARSAHNVPRLYYFLPSREKEHATAPRNRIGREGMFSVVTLQLKIHEKSNLKNSPFPSVRSPSLSLLLALTKLSRDIRQFQCSFRNSSPDYGSLSLSRAVKRPHVYLSFLLFCQALLSSSLVDAL